MAATFDKADADQETRTLTLSVSDSEAATKTPREGEIVAPPVVETPPVGGGRWNRSQADKVAKGILGPWARVWKHNGEITIGIQHGDKKLPLASGSTYAEAIQRTFVEPLKARKELERLRREEAAKAQAEVLPAAAPTEPPAV